MRIIQILPTISYGDAVGNNALAIRRLINDMGHETHIYAENIDTKLPKGTASYVSDLPELNDEDLIIYHGSTGTELNYMLPKLCGRKIMIYHNITPPEFFRGYSHEAERLTTEGLKGIKYLADKLDYCIAVSEFNKKELLKMGFTCQIDVCPVLIPFSDYGKKPSEKVIRQFAEDGYTNLLFVGRIAPNKKQEDVIRAFYYYQKKYNPKSRLFLVGSWNGMELYYKRLVTYAERLGISDKVFFTGHISFSEILAYYKIADVFLCMSEHEGFCVPVVEAMYFGIPIVAYDSSAVGDTLGDGGILVGDKDPLFAAALIDRIINEQKLYNHIMEAGNKRLIDFRHNIVSEKIRCLLTSFLGNGALRIRHIAQLSSTISRGDAVSNDIMAFQRVIMDMGYSSSIYTEYSPKGDGWEYVRNTSELLNLKSPDVAIYHHATGTPLAEQFAQLPCRKVLVYHNITPPEFFADFDMNAEKACKEGLKNLNQIKNKVDYYIADSEFNKHDLRMLGVKAPIGVCPVLITFEDYEIEPDKNVLNTYSDDCINIIFVGRVAPNKKFEDVISAFAFYKENQPKARLILIGSYDNNSRYYNFLQENIRKLQVQDVIFTGHIKFSEIVAYYKVADVFLCMSEHEGFCVPLLEAMYFDVPIIAYASTAIPETLGGSGILLKNKSPESVCAELIKITTDKQYKENILHKQRERLKDFSYGKVSKILKSELERILGD